MKLSQNAVELIKEFEGFSLTPYKCPAGVITVGWGSTEYGGRPIKETDVFTVEALEDMLWDDLRHFEVGVDKLIHGVNQNQFDALISFSYNLGLGNLEKSTLRKKINIDPNDPLIRNEFLKWNRAGGKVLAGLTRRRAAEADLYFKTQHK